MESVYNIIFPLQRERRNELWSQEHSRNLNAYWQLKEAEPTKINTLWFQLHDILEKAQPGKQWKEEWLPDGEAEGRFY